MSNNFFTAKGFKEIGKEIYVYENFLSQEEIFKYKSVADEFANNGKWEVFYKGTEKENKVTSAIPEMEEIRFKMLNLLGNTYNLGRSLAVNKMSVGDIWKIHADNHDFIPLREKSKTLMPGDPYDIIEDTKYGTVVYFNNFEGGELFYPHQCIVYKPKPGDLLIHSSEEFCTHGVAKVTGGYRYSYSNFLSEDLKVPK